MEILTDATAKLNNTAVAIGNFDGVHTAHRALIRAATEASGLTSVVFTFSPHTQSVFGKKLERIVSEKEKYRQIEALMPDFLYVQKCDKSFLQKSPEDFAKEVLVRTLGAKAVFVGYNFRFGKNGAGTPDTLAELGKELGFEVCVMPPKEFLGEPVSSSRIRQALRSGDIAGANAMLGRPYSVSGKVVYGKRLGRTLGFPTVNLEPDDDLAMPKAGVYATKTVWSKKTFDSVTNVGTNPTVGGDRVRVETNIMSLDKDLYNEDITVLFYDFLRPEIRFGSLEELKCQIEKDRQNAKKCLTKTGQLW